MLFTVQVLSLVGVFVFAAVVFSWGLGFCCRVGVVPARRCCSDRRVLISKTCYCRRHSVVHFRVQVLSLVGFVCFVVLFGVIFMRGGVVRRVLLFGHVYGESCCVAHCLCGGVTFCKMGSFGWGGFSSVGPCCFSEPQAVLGSSAGLRLFCGFPEQMIGGERSLSPVPFLYCIDY